MELLKHMHNKESVSNLLTIINSIGNSCFTWLFIAIAVTSANVHGAAFVIEGEVVTKGFFNDGQSVTNVSWGEFKLCNYNTGWQIHYTIKGWTNADQEGWVFEYDSGTDGRLIYTLGKPLRPIKASTLEKLSKKIKLDQIPCTAHIEPAKVPKAMGITAISVLWYCFCSNEYLKDAKNAKVDPPYLNAPLSLQAAAAPDTAIIDRHVEFPYLPRFITFIDSGKRIDVDFVLHQRPKEYEGFTNAILKTENLSQFGTQWFPKQVTYEEYLPRSASGSGGRFCVTRCEVFVNKFEDVKRIIADLPQIKPNTRIVDRRFASLNKPRFTFCYTTNKWLSDSEIRNIPGFNDVMRKASVPGVIRESKQSVKPQQRLVLLMVWVVVSGTVVFAVWKKKVKTKQNKKV